MFKKPFILAVVSGKGGVGKSIASVNIADKLYSLGYSTAIVDADLGLANCATLMNEPVHASVTQWIAGACALEEIPRDCSGTTLVTASNEPGQQPSQAEWLMDAMDQVTEYLAKKHQFIIIDTPAGAGEMTLWALDKANMGILILVDEPTAISDVYRLCKYIYNIDPEYQFASLVNFAENADTAESTFDRFNMVLEYFLKKRTEYLGYLSTTKEIKEAIRQQRRLLQNNAEPKTAEELDFIAQNIVGLANIKPKQPSTVTH